MARGYFRILVFACGLLVGIQVPGFMDQYQKRVEAHFQEVRTNLSGFQRTADRYFGGSLAALISHYRNSVDPVFADDAESVGALHRRYRMLLAQQQAMSGPWYRAGFHLLFYHNDELLAETFAQYSYTVPLNPPAAAWGLAMAFVLSFLLENLLVFLYRGLRTAAACRRKTRILP